MNPRAAIENYDEKRAELIAANRNLTGLVLREREQRLDALLTEWKAAYAAGCGKGKFDVPVLTDAEIPQTPLYRFCSRLPKGGDLHVHDLALLPLDELIALLRECPEICINVTDGTFRLAKALPDGAAPEGHLPFPEAMERGRVRREDLLQNWTVVGAAGYPGGIWPWFEEIFDRQAVLSDNPAFAAKYYRRALRYYVLHGISHVEIHLMLTGTMEESEEYVRTLRDAYYDVKREYPFFTLRIIGAGVKADSEQIEFTRRCFLNASYVQETVKDESGPDGPEDLVIGFDLVNEEDQSLPLRAFAPMLLKVRRQYPAMRLFIHGGESLSASNENLVDAYLLGVSRVGHGLNLYRWPDLHARYVREEIALEVCPVSNQRLGYTVDMRTHPATEYLRTGLPLTLCSDDPAFMERETLTDDYFAAVSAWDLTLADLKQLGINSIAYSGLSGRAKTGALKAYSALWERFLDEMLGE